MRRADAIFYSTMAALIVATVYTFLLSPPAQRCHAKGGNLSMTFNCNKITVTPLD